MLHELSNVFIVGPVSSTIAEVLAALQEDISGVMHLTNERSPFFSLQVQFNEEVGRILSNFTVNADIVTIPIAALGIVLILCQHSILTYRNKSVYIMTSSLYHH